MVAVTGSKTIDYTPTSRGLVGKAIWKIRTIFPIFRSSDIHVLLSSKLPVDFEGSASTSDLWNAQLSRSRRSLGLVRVSTVTAMRDVGRDWMCCVLSFSMCDLFRATVTMLTIIDLQQLESRWMWRSETAPEVLGLLEYGRTIAGARASFMNTSKASEKPYTASVGFKNVRTWKAMITV